MRTLKTQKGITMIGFAMMLCIAGFFAYAAMKSDPAYTEYYGVDEIDEVPAGNRAKYRKHGH